MNAINGALSGLKIVACSTAQAGTVPYMLMADLGADVIKIETPVKEIITVNQVIYLEKLVLFLKQTIVVLRV